MERARGGKCSFGAEKGGVGENARDAGGEWSEVMGVFGWARMKRGRTQHSTAHGEHPENSGHR